MDLESAHLPLLLYLEKDGSDVRSDLSRRKPYFPVTVKKQLFFKLCDPNRIPRE